MQSRLKTKSVVLSLLPKLAFRTIRSFTDYDVPPALHHEQNGSMFVLIAADIVGV